MTIIDTKKSKEYYKYHPRFIYNLDETSKKSSIGNKAQNLRFLQKKNFNIPLTYVCNFEAFDLYKRGFITLFSNLKQELKFYIEDEKSYSISSSANIEDESFKSFAGQFQTILNRKGIEEISESIIKVWKSHEDIKPQTYSKMFSQNPNQIKFFSVHYH